MRYATRVILSFALVGIAFLFDSGGMLGTTGAWAQNATGLKCNGCVKSRQIKNGKVKGKDLKDLTITGSKIDDGAVGTSKLSTELQDHVAERQSFYIVLDTDGAEETIATNGVLSYFVRCLINSGGLDRVEIYVTSSVDGWWHDDGVAPQLANDEILKSLESQATGTSDYDEEPTDGSAVGPDGSYLAIEGDSLGLGVNIFGHACIAVGTVTSINGTL